MLGLLFLGCAAATAQYYPLHDPYEDYIAATDLSDIFQGPHTGSSGNVINHCSRETSLRTDYSDHRTIRDNICSVKCAYRPDDPSCAVWNALCWGGNFPKMRAPQGDCSGGTTNGDQETCAAQNHYFDRDVVRFVTGVPDDCVNHPDGPGSSCRCRPGALDDPGCEANDYKQATYDGAAEAEYACHANAICANRDDLLKMCLLEDDCTHVDYGLMQVRPNWNARRRSATDTYADVAFSIGYLHNGCTPMGDSIEKQSGDETGGNGQGGTLTFSGYRTNLVHTEMMVNGYYLTAPKLVTRTALSDIGECALGKGLVLSAPGNADMQGLYVMSGGSYCSTPDMIAKGCYEHEVGGHVIEPHYSGCSWVVSRKMQYTESSETCSRTDNHDALNWALGQCDDIHNCAADLDYDPNLCQTMATIWSGDEGGSDGAFCQNRVFKGLCPATCNLPTPCFKDMGGSIEWWSVMHPGEPMPAAAPMASGIRAKEACDLFDAAGECDPVIQQVCPLGGDGDSGRTACHDWSRRLAEGVANKAVPKEAAQAFRRSLSETVKRRRLGTSRNLAVNPQAIHTPVGNNVAHEMEEHTTDHFYLREVYLDVEPKFDDGFLNADCRDYAAGGRTTEADYDSPQTRNPDPWTSGEVYKVADLLTEKASVSIQVDCGVSKTRWREKYNTFCELDNINSEYHRDERLVKNRCSVKCAGKTVDEVDADGNHSYCDGNGYTPDTPDLPNITNRIGLDLASTKKHEDSLALCLPRSRCEQLCDELDECLSIDMHRYRNRCYLNLVDHTTGTCSADGNYDLIYKRSTRANWFADPPLSSSNVQTHFDDINRHTWVTYDVDCSHIDSENEITLNEWAQGANWDSSETGQTSIWDSTDWSYTPGGLNGYWLQNENNENGWASGWEDEWFELNLDSYDTSDTGVTREFCEYAFSQGTRTTATWDAPQDDKAYDGIAGFQFEYFDSTINSGYTGSRAVGRCKPIGWKDLPKNPDGTPNCPAANTTRWDHDQFRPKTYFVMKVAYEPCTAEVSGVDADFDGTYVQLVDAQVLPAYPDAFEYGTWGKLDNSTQISYRRPGRGTASDGCGAWYMEKNRLSPVSRTVHNCTDQPEAAAAYFALLGLSNFTGVFDAPLNAGGPPGMEFPCQWAKERGNCTNDAVLPKLCPHTCNPVLRVRTETARQNYWRHRGQSDYEESDPAAQTYFFQDTTAAKCAADGNTVDNNQAFKALVNMEWTSFNAGQLPSSIAGLSTKYAAADAGYCANLLTVGAGYWYTYGRWPCEDLPEAPIVRVLCQATCSTADPPPAPPGASPTLENTPNGALQRRLAARSGQTTSYATAGASITFSWTPFPTYDLTSIRTSWAAHYATQVNGSHDVNRWHDVLGTPELTVNVGGEPYLAGSENILPVSTLTCPNVERQNGKTAQNYGLFGTEALSWYPLKLAPAPGASINKICAEAPLCPPLTKCFLTPKRFTDEMHSFRLSHGVARGAYVSSIDGDEKEVILADGNFVPRVLVSQSRVEAIFRGARSVAVAGSLARADLEASRFDIDQDPARTDFGEYTIVTVAPAAQRCDGGTDLPCGELGRTFTAPAGGVGYTMWRSDVLRVERFDEDRKAKTAGSFTFTVTMPGGDASSGLYKVYRFPPAAHSEPVDVETEGGVVEKLAPGVVRVTVGAVNSDFAVIEDADECQGHLQFGDDAVLDFQACDHEVGTCVNTLGSYECHCPSDTHVAKDAVHRVDTVECVLQHQEHFDYYLRITHLDRLNYGWRIQDVRLFEAPDCSGQAIGAGVAQPWQEYCPNHVGGGAYTTGCLGVSEQRATQDHPAYRNFNGNDHTAPGNLGRHGDEWWSGCLTCNPDEFDDSHGSAASLLVLVDQSVTVQCVELRHNNGMYATNRIKVERGPLVDTGCHIDTNRCVPTMTWQGEGGGAVQGQRLDIQVSTTCGTVGRHIYGEIITPNEFAPTTDGVTAHYANMVDVRSACHCQTLCRRTLDNGCESWSYKPQANTPCVLQGKVLHSEVSMADWGGYTSGLPHESVIALGGGLSTAPILRGAALDDGVLTLDGYGFPTRENGADKSRYQRVKLVESGAPCHAPVPASVTGISCLATTLDNGSGGKRSVHTVCSTRPSDAAADGRSVAWSGIGLVGNHLLTDYNVCYCSGKSCHLPGSWSKVTQGVDQATVWPGLAAGGTGHYTFTAEVDGSAGHEVPREGALLALVVDVDLAATDVADWELKIVPSQFDCSVDPHVFPAPTKSDETVNSAKFTFDVNGTVADVGTYIVCFRGDAAAAWTQIFHKHADLVAGSHVIALTEHSAGDRTHPRAVYTSQFWSAQSGAEARELHLAGTGLPTPTDSKVYFSSGGCGSAHYNFSGAVVTKSADGVAPQLVVSQIEPPSGTSASAVTILELAFDEIVQAADGCVGSYHLVAADGTVGLSVHCTNATYYANLVHLDISALTTAGTYSLVIDAYVVADMADTPNVALRIAPDNYELTIAAASAGVAPRLLHAHSYDPTAANVAASNSYTSSPLELVWSEEVALTTDYDLKMDLYSCGADFVCNSTDDVLLWTYRVVALGGGSNVTWDANVSAISVDGRTVSVDLEAVPNGLDDATRYLLRFDTGAILDGAGGAIDGFDVEVVRHFAADSFDYANVISASAASTGSKYAFDVALVAEEGTYTVCYCDEMQDENHLVRGDGDTTYKVTQDAIGGADGSGNATVGSRGLDEHVCQDKCHAGCVGDDCFCDGWDAAPAGAYCLSPALCREACDAIGCSAISTRGNTCLLATSGGSTPSVGWQYFERIEGTACTDLDDFTEVGTLTVTDHVDLGVTYVVAPGKSTTFEVTGANILQPLEVHGGHKFHASRGRIMVVDCDGQCGASGPAAGVHHAVSGAALTLDDYIRHAPVQHYEDPAGDGAGSRTTEHFEPTAQAMEYLPMPDRYCPEGNIDLSSANVAIDGMLRSAGEHQCYRKCLLDGCDEETGNCHCSGALSGFDGPDSNAVCGDLELCQALCDGITTCTGFDKHESLDRCFLNFGCGSGHESDLQPDPKYTFYKRTLDPAAQDDAFDAGRRLHDDASLPALDRMVSYPSMLRYTDIEFRTGGSYKMCFCDGGSGCNKAEDFTLQVGTVEASGMACLLETSTYSRSTCVGMGVDGDQGLRCYAGDAPEVEITSLFPPAEGRAAGAGAGQVPDLDTYCVLHPERCGIPPR